MRHARTSVMVGALIAVTAVSAFQGQKGCTVFKNPACPGGASQLNGKRCGSGAVLEVSDEIVRTKEPYCLIRNYACQNAHLPCNAQGVMDATWRKINCVKGDTRKFYGWCRDDVFSIKPNGLGCDGRVCKIEVR